jgi:hypothetical protein
MIKDDVQSADDLTARDFLDEQGCLDPGRVPWEARNASRFTIVNGHRLEARRLAGLAAYDAHFDGRWTGFRSESAIEVMRHLIGRAIFRYSETCSST